MNVRDAWEKLLVPDCEGLLDSENQFRELGVDGRLSAPRIRGGWAYLDAQVLGRESVLSGKYVVSCGEVSGHGSIGFAVVENTLNSTEFWVFVSENTDPFDQILVKGGFVLILSTSGFVLRFRLGSSEVQCFPSR